MIWNKKWSGIYGRFEYISSDELIIIFKDTDGFKYRFQPSCSTETGSGYATSIHFWKSLRAVKLYLEKNTHFMVVVDSDSQKDFCEYVIKNGNILRVN